LAEATKSDRRVLLHFGAPWCPWCHVLENFLAIPKVKELMAKDYVDRKIDVDRTEGGKDLDQKVRDGKQGGIPWFVILDKDGKQLITSDGPKGNIGAPVQSDEIEHFLGMLNKTRSRLTE